MVYTGTIYSNLNIFEKNLNKSGVMVFKFFKMIIFVNISIQKKSKHDTGTKNHVIISLYQYGTFLFINHFSIFIFLTLSVTAFFCSKSVFHRMNEKGQ